MPRGSGGCFYAVKVGKIPGVYMSWSECEEQVKGTPKARFKKFSTLKEAEDFVFGNGPSLIPSTSTFPNIPFPPMPGPSIPNFLPNIQQPLPGPTQSVIPGAAVVPTLAPQVGDVGALSLMDLAQIRSLPRKLCDTTSLLGQHLVDSSNYVRSLRIRPSTQRDPKVATTLQCLDEVLLKAQSQMECLKELISQSKVYANQLVHSKNKRPSDSTSSAPPVKRVKPENAVQRIVEVYTDGCCHDNGRETPRAGLGVFWGDNHPNNLSEKLKGRQTNNRAEIQAARKAILQARTQGYDKIVIHTDSQFLINCVTKWIHRWKKNGWQLVNGRPVLNRKDLEQVDEAMIGIDVEWKHVKGHAGVYGNEMADRLANEGARMPYVPQPGDSEEDDF